jgi:hypothetical protein
MDNRRVEAVEAYVKAFRTGEHSAADKVAGYLADDVVLVGGRQDSSGKQEVLKYITGQWPNTPTYLQAAWSEIEPDGDQLKVGAKISGLGAAPAGVNLTFSFNAADQISRVEQEIVPQTSATPTDKLPDFAKAMVNNALANGTPITVAYVDGEGRPVLSLRGSTQVYSDTQLAIWLRSAEGGLNRALEKNPNISLLYRDQRSRSTLVFQGRGHIETDEDVRKRVWEMAPEIEQNHDPSRLGAALIIDLDRVQGGTPRGGVRMARSGS